MIHPDFQEHVDERGLVPWSAVAERYAGQEVGVHMHAPLSKKLGTPVLSVLHNGRAVAVVPEAHLDDPSVGISKYHLEQSLNNPVNERTGKAGKTRNTLMLGTPTMPRNLNQDQMQRVVMGAGTAGTSNNPTAIFAAKTVPGEVRMRPRGGQPAQVVRGTRVTGPSRSAVFAEHVRIGQGGIQAHGLRF